MPIVLKSGSNNLLEPSGPVQACNGIAIFLLLCLCIIIIVSLRMATLTEAFFTLTEGFLTLTEVFPCFSPQL